MFRYCIHSNNRITIDYTHNIIPIGLIDIYQYGRLRNVNITDFNASCSRIATLSILEAARYVVTQESAT